MHPKEERTKLFCLKSPCPTFPLYSSEYNFCKENFSLTTKKIKIAIVIFLVGFINIQTMTAQDSFENSFDSWTNLSRDDFDWTNLSGDTPSANTSPTTASLNDYYIYRNK